MHELEHLRADLHASVRAACLGEASRLAGEGPNPALPTEATIEEFSRWISTSAAPVANAHLAIHTGLFALGASRLVAPPDMPNQLAWPQHMGRPLAFLAQIDLASLPEGIDWPVPPRGWLYFFLGANPNGVEVGEVDASPNRTLYFGGDVSELRTRQAPDGTVVPLEFRNAVPYDLTFELGLSVPMGMSGEVDTPWHRFANMSDLDLGNLLLDRKPPVIREYRDRMFGLPRHDQLCNSQFQAAAMTAGEMKAQQTFIEQEAPHWCSLFSLGSHLYRSTAGTRGTWHFNWWSAQTYRVLVDERKSRAGDFAQTFIYISD